jgi:hypothetical protein
MAVNTAIPEQREAILALFAAVAGMPNRADVEAYELYQRKVMQPLRDEIQRLKIAN